MTASEAQKEHDPRFENVLTLAETAAYLRVPVAAVEQLLVEQGIPARKIGAEWRFSRKALDLWLRFPGRHPRDYWQVDPHWLLESPFVEELVVLLQERLLQNLRQSAPPREKPGSKQAVLKHFGVFQDEDDLEEHLADAKRRREAEG
jgi:excisionase family DNA binding protein